MALNIYIPETFKPERLYIIDILFNEFLGLEYNVQVSKNIKDYHIEIDNTNKLIIEDSFFSKTSETKGYLHQEFIPNKIEYYSSDFSADNNMPVLFGIPEIHFDSNNVCICKIDIFSSSFFMLSRWEEFVVKTKDQYQRFPDKLALSQRMNFHYRPIVNEYCELLWTLLKKNGLSAKRKERKAQLVITHDVDNIIKYKSCYNYLRTTAKNIIYDKSLKEIKNTVKQYISTLRNYEDDIFYTFDFLMSVSESVNLKSNFFFIPNIKGETDFRYSIYSPKIKKTITEITKRGHHIGLHGTFESYNKPQSFKNEFSRFSDIGVNILHGRQHYLRFENPTTWQLWNENNLRTDSTMSFSNDGGFRCGTCFQYSVFDIIRRKKLQLKESPLIVMEVALKAKYPSVEKFYNKCIELAETTKRYNGQFVLLWHNDNILSGEWQHLGNKYKQLIKELAAICK
jgi:hypothetical protein